MRVLAARFAAPDKATAALDRLQRELRVDPPDAAVAPLGRLGQPPGPDFVLAGRFRDDQAEDVIEVVADAGGQIVANVDEDWTLPRQPSGHAPRLSRKGLNA